MPIDPRLADISAANEPAIVLATRVADLERRLARLEQLRPPISVGDDAPTVAAPEGTLAGARTTPRLWLRIDGAWKYTALT